MNNPTSRKWDEQSTPPHLGTKLALSKSDAARALGLSDRSVDDLIADGSLPHVRIGRRVLIPVDALRAWLAARTVGGDAPTPAEGGAA